ncbi:MAG TPA: periplasmic nitrate reductase, NapE protein [Burkholderiales bacterium]|nr:periplasmic nitrate reductase, NapE protein [Burkholderiales bacterium]
MVESERREPTRAQEVGTLLILLAIVAPLLAVMIVGGYGFLVWMYQVFIAGPPGG